MADEARLNEILDIAEQAKAEGDTKTFEEMMALFEQESASPSAPAAPPAPPAKPQAPPEPQMSDNPFEVLGGGLDAAATLVSGAFATPVAGLVGLGAAGLDQIPGVDIDAPGVIDATQSLLTHDPMSETGQAMVNTIATPFEALNKAGEELGDRNLEATGSPAWATAAQTLVQGLPDILGLRGARGAGAAVNATRRMAPTAEGRLLQNEGVDLKRSQMGSRVGQWFDSAADDVLGESAFDRRQSQQLNAAVLNRADPRGNVPHTNQGQVRVSPDVMRDLKNDVGREYDALHARRDTPLDMQLEGDLNAAIGEAAADGIDVGDPGGRRVIAQVENFRRLARANGGRVPGKAGQNIRSKLGKLSQSDDGFVAHFARQVRDALDGSWERGARNSRAFDDVERMAEVRARFRMNDALEKTMRGNATGNVSPKTLYSKTQAGHPLEDLALAAKNVLPDNLANSGTPARGANIGKVVAMANPNRWGDLAKTLAGAAGGRMFNESPNMGAKAGVLARQPSAQLTAAGGAGEAALDAENRATEEFLRALGL